MDRLAQIQEALERSRAFGFLGPGPVEAHISHTEALAAASARHFDSSIGGLVLDLGSGGGVPGLVLAALWPVPSFVFIESNTRRVAFLAAVVDEWGWSAHVRVVCDRAEVAARDGSLRGLADLVVARSFGRPAVTAECAAGFLRVDGLLAVTEPPFAEQLDTRWPAAPLRDLGLVPVESVASPVAVQLLRQEAGCPDRFPRRTGVPSKRPLF